MPFMKQFILSIAETVVNAVSAGKTIEGRLKPMCGADGQKYIAFFPYDRKPRVRRPDELVKKLRSGWIRLSIKRLKVFASASNELGAQEAVDDLKEQIVKGLDAILRDDKVTILRPFNKR